MADHKYTVATDKGDVNLTTPNHHSSYETIKKFLDDHKTEINTALGAGTFGVSVLGLYLSHGRAGTKIH